MKRTKKSIFVSLSLAASILASGLSVFAASYSDVADDSWYKTYVDYVSNKGWMNGDSDGTFRPADNITRAEYVTVLVNKEKPVALTQKTLLDVPSDAWYSDYMSRGVAAGYITGDDNGTYRPDDYITREEACMILYRAAGLAPTDTDVLTFSDKDDISIWATEVINKLVAEGVISGYDDGTFKPKANITRAEIAVLLMNADQKLVKSTTAPITTTVSTGTTGTTGNVSTSGGSLGTASAGSSGGSSGGTSSKATAKPTTAPTTAPEPTAAPTLAPITSSDAPEAAKAVETIEESAVNDVISGTTATLPLATPAPEDAEPVAQEIVIPEASSSLDIAAVAEYYNTTVKAGADSSEKLNTTELNEAYKVYVPIINDAFAEAVNNGALEGTDDKATAAALNLAIITDAVYTAGEKIIGTLEGAEESAETLFADATRKAEYTKWARNYYNDVLSDAVASTGTTQADAIYSAVVNAANTIYNNAKYIDTIDYSSADDKQLALTNAYEKYMGYTLTAAE